MRKLITATCFWLFAALFMPQLNLRAQTCPAGQISGNVFRDFNYNGLNDEATPFPIAGMTVYLYTPIPSGGSSLTDSTVTSATGTFMFTGKTNGTKYRVEFVPKGTLAAYRPTFFNADNGTSVQFVTAPSCVVKASFALPDDFCVVNPYVLTPCYVSGAPLPSGMNAAGDEFAVIASKLNAPTIGGNINIAGLRKTGSLWGAGYEKKANTFFSSAVLRRHSGFGPGGTGAIYAWNLTNINAPQSLGWFSLDSLGFDTGTDFRTGADTLPLDKTVASYDVMAFDQIGKMSLGGMDISADGKYMFVMNLFDRKLYRIFTNSPYVKPSTSDVTSYALTNPGCGTNNNDWRPWGVKVHNGEVYVGIVCTAESNPADSASLHAWIKKLNPSGGFDPVFDFPLDYDRGFAFFQHPDINDWNPWTSDYMKTLTVPDMRFEYPQAILSDLEFDADGSIIVGFMDRMGHQSGFKNFPPDKTKMDLLVTDIAGDITRICNNNGVFQLEGGTGCTTPNGLNNNQGPGGSEYYWSDTWPNNSGNPTGTFIVHSEISVGGLTTVPGTGEVISTIIDPQDANTGGWTRFVHATGARSASHQIYEELAGFSGKSNGLGDVVVLCPPAPIEKGNFVWKDVNKDGIQDPNEPPIPGVNVSLVDSATCMVVKTVQTNTAGEYYFNKSTIGGGDSVHTNTTYYIVVGNGGQFTTVLFDSLTLTLPNIGTGADKNINDSDGEIGGSPCFATLPAVKFSTKGAGEVDHTCDFGFFVGCQIEISAIVSKEETCFGDKTGKITITAIKATNVEYSIDGGQTFQSSNMFNNLGSGTYEIVVKDLDINNCIADSSVTLLPGIIVEAPSATGNFAVCQFENTPANMGLTAVCATCPNGLPQAITWWSAPTGGTMVGIGSPFDPIAAGKVNKNVVGMTTFYAQCECGPCESARKAAIFTVNPLPVPAISGEKFPCPNSTYLYTTPFHVGSTWIWSATGGTVVSQNGNTANVHFASISGDFQISVKETSDLGCMKSDTFDVTIRPTSIACKTMLNVSLNDMCMVTLTPQLLLDGNYPTLDGYTIMITDANNNPVSGDKITGKGLWKFKVTEPCIGNSCWGNLKTEDKLPPKFICLPRTVPCSQTNVAPVIPDLTGMPALVNIGGIGGVTIEDNCALVQASFVDQFMDFDCASNSQYSAKITRTWTATDMSGNIATCSQMIFFERKLVGDVDFPADYYSENCDIKNTSPSVTGVPTIDENSIWPSSAYCEINAQFNDQILPICDGSVKIIRKWTVLDWCLPVGTTNPRYFTQVIKIIDKTGPTFDCPANFVASTDLNSCFATVDLPDFLASDNCSRIKSATAYLTLPSGITQTLIGNLTNQQNIWGTKDTFAIMSTITNLPIGDHVVTYIVEDDCGNTSKCTFTILVTDLVPPTAICQEFTKVALGTDGLALVDAESFNSGSYDYCDAVWLKVKRMDASVCVPAGQNKFSDFTQFCCSDIGDTVTVILRVYDVEPTNLQLSDDDLEGHFNQCMVRVLIEDKLKPTCTAPSNVTVACEAFDPTFWSYGQPVAHDNCGIDTILVSLGQNQFNSTCNNGVVIRTWTVIDDGGNKGKCSQKITVTPKTDFTVQFPDDKTLNNCVATGNYGAPIITGENCEIIATNYEDVIFTVQPDACFKILRTWTIINWCDYDANWTIYELPNPTNTTTGAIFTATNANHGLVKYTQIIKVTDNVDPVISCPTGAVVFTDFSDNDPLQFAFNGHDHCEGNAPLTAKAHDLCAGANVNFSYILKLDLDGDGVMESTWNSNQPGTPPISVDFNAISGDAEAKIEGLVLPYGNHLVKWIATDGCGNDAACEYPFTVKDGKKPTVTCINGLAVNQMQQGAVTLWASDFLLYAADNCTPSSDLVFGIRKSGAGSGFPNTTSISFNCDNLGTNSIELWAKDAAGNADFCATYCIVSDNTGACGSTTAAIAGFLTTKLNDGIDNVAVKITGSQVGLPSPEVFTGLNGGYNFSAIPIGDNYVITPEKDLNPTNGVNTFDIVDMSKHVLNVTPFTTPGQYLAADINHNGNVTTADIVELRKLILGIYDKFPQNESWRFIEKNYAFDMSQNPLGQPFQETISIQNLQNSTANGDFTGVKIGDINLDAVPNNLVFVADRNPVSTIYFEMLDKKIEKGEILEVPFRATDLENVAGWQFTLGFDKTALEFDGFVGGKMPNLSIENFGFHRLADGLLTTSWNGDLRQILDNETLFTLRFLVKKAGKTANFFKIGCQITAAEGYSKTAENLDLALRFRDSMGNQTITSPQFELFQNEPNPFSDHTKISFQLPESANVSLRIYDARGSLALEKTANFAKGRQSFELSGADLNGTGLFFYEISDGNNSAVRKLILRN